VLIQEAFKPIRRQRCASGIKCTWADAGASAYTLARIMLCELDNDGRTGGPWGAA